MAKNINFAYEPIKIYFLEKKSEFSDHKNLSGSLRKQQKASMAFFVLTVSITLVPQD
jgi:hypothetical protein